MSDSTFAFAGLAKPHIADSAFLIKIDWNGNILWSRKYWSKNKSGFIFYPNTLTKTPDGGLLMGGQAYANAFKSPYLGVALLKTNDTGGVVWGNFYDLQAGNNSPVYAINKILNLPGGGYLINGTEIIDGYPWIGSFILKIDANGNPLWRNSYGSYKQAGLVINISDMVLTPKAIYISCAFPTLKSSNLNLLKINYSGNLIWTKTYSGAAGFINDLIYDSVKNQLLLATDYGSSTTSYFARIDTSGHFLNSYLYPNATFNTFGPGHTGTNTNPPSAFIQIPNGFAMLFISPAPDYGYYIIKTDTGGNTNNCGTQSFNPVVTNLILDSIQEKPDTTNLAMVAYRIKVSPVAIVTSDSVFCDPFVSWFTWRDSCYKQTTQFYDSTYLGSDSWLWNFGDPSSGSANTSKIKNPTHSFTSPGTYKVKMIVGNPAGNVDSIVRIVHILAPPKSFTVDTTICGGDSVNLLAASTGAHYS